MKHDGELVRLWRIAETATRSEERKTFHEMIAFAQTYAHELAGVVFAKLDRACRNPKDYATLELLETDYKIKLISVNQTFEDNPTGRLGRRIQANFNAYQTEQMSVDIRKGQAKRAESGLPHGRPNYGYHLVRKDGRNKHEIHLGHMSGMLQAFR